MKVPWLPKQEIALRAQKVLSAHEGLTGKPIEPPIPVEDIIERTLILRLSYEDLQEGYGLKGVIGALYVDLRRICVDLTLVDEAKEGRLSFTCGHEAGHWVLHRHLIKEATRPGRPQNIICRLASAKEPVEWQADYFAACLLMPEDSVRNAFRRAVGEECLVLENAKSALGGTRRCVDACAENWHYISEYVCEAGGFSNVSKQAMMIRLLDLGLVANCTGTFLGWRQNT
jgi:Zn-dependent peptidase ImmA (M78 family)